MPAATGLGGHDRGPGPAAVSARPGKPGQPRRGERGHPGPVTPMFARHPNVPVGVHRAAEPDRGPPDRSLSPTRAKGRGRGWCRVTRCVRWTASWAACPSSARRARSGCSRRSSSVGASYAASDHPRQGTALAPPAGFCPAGRRGYAAGVQPAGQRGRSSPHTTGACSATRRCCARSAAFLHRPVRSPGWPACAPRPRSWPRRPPAWRMPESAAPSPACGARSRDTRAARHGITRHDTG